MVYTNTLDFPFVVRYNIDGRLTLKENFVAEVTIDTANRSLVVPGSGELSRHELIKEASSKLPLNRLGLPEGFYRSDLVAPYQMTSPTPTSDEHSDQALKRAYVALDYSEGFPALPDGRPYWSRFEFEPTDAFDVFQIYLDQGRKSARQIFHLPDSPGVVQDLVELQEFFNLYYWETRSKAFDLFRAAAGRKERALRALNVEDRHYMIAERLLDKCLMYLGINPDTLDFESAEDSEEFWELLTPKTAIDFLKTLSQLQRVSVGLPASGPLPTGPNQSANGLSSMEVILRTLHQENADPDLLDISVTDGDGEKITAKLLQNPEALRTAQELIIKLSSGTPGTTND